MQAEHRGAIGLGKSTRAIDDPALRCDATQPPHMWISPPLSHALSTGPVRMGSGRGDCLAGWNPPCAGAASMPVTSAEAAAG
jgi:hypothetical protein